MRRHVDPETLAAFGEELLPRRKARRVAAHLAHCAQCAGLDAQLAGLPALLASAPAPPMPDALTTRIEAALAAEAAARSATAAAGARGSAAATGAGAPSAGPPEAAGTAHDRPGRAAAPRRAAAPGRSRLALRVAAVTAAVVVVAGGGYGVSRLLSGSGPAATSAPALAPAAGLPAHAPAASRPQGAERTGAAGSATGERPASLRPAADLVVASGTDYQPGQLQAQVKAVLARFGKAQAPSAGGTSGPANGAASLAACVAHVAGGLRPRLVDQARYDGKPATIIVVPAGPTTLRVLVAGPRCSAAATDLITSTVMPGPR